MQVMYTGSPTESLDVCKIKLTYWLQKLKLLMIIFLRSIVLHDAPGLGFSILSVTHWEAEDLRARLVQAAVPTAGLGLAEVAGLVGAAAEGPAPAFPRQSYPGSSGSS